MNWLQVCVFVIIILLSAYISHNEKIQEKHKVMYWVVMLVILVGIIVYNLLV